LYPKVLQRLSWQDGEQIVGAEGADASAPARALLDRWAAGVLGRAGLRKEALRKPFDADVRVYGELERTLLRTNLASDITRAFLAFARAAVDNDAETSNWLVHWFAGFDAVSIPVRYLRPPQRLNAQEQSAVQLRALGKGSVREALRGLLWLVRQSGLAGLVLCLDEIEELAKLPSRKRQDQALQALREYVDNAGGDGAYRHMAMYLAATPEMFDSPNYFPRYDALATRIQPVGEAVNWRAPVVDLDRTTLDQKQLIEVSKKIIRIHQIAFEAQAELIPHGFVVAIVEELARTRLRFAKPRLLARVVVDELERARQDPSSYLPPDAKDVLLATGKRLEAQLTK